MKSYRLGNVCRVYRVNYDDDVAHRADYDAEVLGAVFKRCYILLCKVEIIIYLI